MTQAILELRNLTKRFGSSVAVNGISLNVGAGEIYGFLGPNGAGKTTTIKLIATLLKPTSGQVLIDGFDVHSNPVEAKRKLAYVPDQPFIYDKLTGAEFLLFVGKIYGLSQNELYSEIDRVSRVFEIGPWFDKRIEDYSNGMRQRLVLAAAMLHMPMVIVIDEPVVGLDPKGVDTFKREIREAAGRGAAVFLTTHQLHLAQDICSRFGIIHNGKIIYEGQMADFRANGAKQLERLFVELTSASVDNEM
ncbi:MAG: ABC transporter ATP-binding protein [Candidatus Kryptoniota bacterium]